MAWYGVPRLVLSSSGRVYDAVDAPAHEDSPLAPIDPLGRAHLMNEQVLRDVAGAAEHVAALEALEALDDVGRPLSTWNVGSGRPTSVLSLVGTFEAATGRTLPYRVLPRRNPEGYPLAETPETPWRGGVGHRLRLLQGAENGPFW